MQISVLWMVPWLAGEEKEEHDHIPATASRLPVDMVNSQKHPLSSGSEVLLWDAWSQKRTDVNICHEGVQRFRLSHLRELWLNSCHFYSVRGAITISFTYPLISSALLTRVCFSFSSRLFQLCDNTYHDCTDCECNSGKRNPPTLKLSC